MFFLNTVIVANILGGINIKIAMHQPNHWPYLGFIEKMIAVDLFVIFDKGQFVEKDFHHRNRIRDNSPEGFKWLTVPVVKKRAPISDITIDNQRHQKNSWRDLHLHLIDVNYRNARNYQYHKVMLDRLYGREWERLIDLNIAIIKYLIDLFEIKAQVRMSSDIECIKAEIHSDQLYGSPMKVTSGGRTAEDYYLKNVRATQRIINVCKELGADTYVSGIGGRNYLIESLFAAEDIKLEYQQFRHPIYKQCFPGFIQGLSSLDYIMNVDTK